MTTPPPQGPPPGWDPQAPYGRPAEGPHSAPPPFGFQQPQQQWQQPPQFQQVPPQQVPTAPSYTEFWWDGRKWRPPVPRMSRGQAASQLPGALMKLVLLGFLLWILLAAFGIVH